MKTLVADSCQRELTDRLVRWVIMTSHQMVCHLADGFSSVHGVAGSKERIDPCTENRGKVDRDRIEYWPERKLRVATGSFDDAIFPS